MAASNIFFRPSIPDMASTFFLQSPTSTGRSYGQATCASDTYRALATLRLHRQKAAAWVWSSGGPWGLRGPSPPQGPAAQLRLQAPMPPSRSDPQQLKATSSKKPSSCSLSSFPVSSAHCLVRLFSVQSVLGQRPYLSSISHPPGLLHSGHGRCELNPPGVVCC